MNIRYLAASINSNTSLAIPLKFSEVIHLKKYSEHKAHYTINCDTIYAFRVGVTC